MQDLNTHDKALGRLKGLAGIPEFLYDMCPKAGCNVIYRKEFKDLEVCPRPGCQGTFRRNEAGKARRKFRVVGVEAWISEAFCHGGVRQVSILNLCLFSSKVPNMSRFQFLSHWGMGKDA